MNKRPNLLALSAGFALLPTLLFSLILYFIFNPSTKEYFIMSFLLYGICFFTYTIIFSMMQVVK